MTYGYYCAIFPFCGGGKKKKDDKKTKAFYDWATIGIPVTIKIKFHNIFKLSVKAKITKFEHKVNI